MAHIFISYSKHDPDAPRRLRLICRRAADDLDAGLEKEPVERLARRAARHRDRTVRVLALLWPLEHNTLAAC